MTESKQHLVLKNKWASFLDKKGYTIEKERKVESSNGVESVIVDVYAENDEEIVVVEVVNTNWSGKDPRDYLDVEKRIKVIISRCGKQKRIKDMEKEFLRSTPFSNFKSYIKNREGFRQINFWIKEDILLHVDGFLKKQGYKIRTPFIIKCLKIIVKNPDLLKKGFLERLRSDQLLLFELVKLFDQVPCEFEFSAESHEEKRIGEIRSMLKHKDVV